MSCTLIEQLSDFTLDTAFEALPDLVVSECKRIILDSIGCALGGSEELKGRVGLDFARVMGAGSTEATVIGGRERSSMFGAAFANSELINALDFDIVMPPGHVTPYVLPVALAVGENVCASGKELIVATAVAHEMSFRFGRAMDNLRDTKDGKVEPPPIFGYSSTVFGATAQAGRLRGLSREVVASALGIAGSVSPVNNHWSWFKHLPPSTIKYQLGGVVCTTALTASYMAELGHRGDLQVLDDGEFGFRRFIGSRKWAPEQLVDGLGADWRFQNHLSYKPFPHCRVLHTAFAALHDVLEQNQIRPDEIDGLTVFAEAMTDQPVWRNREISHPIDGQFSIAHGMALAAHRLPPSRIWQQEEQVFSPSVLSLMQKVKTDVHPRYVELLSEDAASRPAMVKVEARGQSFIGERRFPKGSKSSDPTSFMTDDELIAKFRVNADGVLSDAATDAAVEAFMNLERVGDVSVVIGRLGNSAEATAARNVA